jgi:hypothetical protein
MTLTTAQVLHAAADLLEPDGAWTQEGYARNADGDELEPTGRGHWSPGQLHTYDDKPVCFCSLGAIAEVAGIAEGDFDQHPAVQAVAAEVLTRGHADGMRSALVARWNDDRLRTKRDVVEAFRAAADKADDLTNGQKGGPADAR